MTRETSSMILEHDALAGIRVLLWLAWDDGALNQEEARSLKDAMRTLPSLQDKAFDAALDTWLDPDNPPSIRDLHRLRAQIIKDDENPQLLTSSEEDALSESLTGLNTRKLRNTLVPLRDTGTHVQTVTSPADDALSDAIRDALEGPWKAQWDAVRSLLKTDAFRHPLETSTDDERERVLQWVKTIAQTGLTEFPSSPDGQIDLSLVARTMHVFSALATFDLSLAVKFGVQFGLFGGSIYFLGNPEQHAEFLGPIASTELLGGFAMTESGHGSNVQGLETTATWSEEHKGFVLHTPSRRAWKEWIGNAGVHGEAMTVFAQLIVDGEAYGVHAFVVRVRDGAAGAPLPGVHIEDCGHKMGLNGVDNGRIAFEHVLVPRTHLLNRYGNVDESGTYTSPIRSENARFFTMLGTLIGGRLAVALGAISAARTALMIAIRYGKQRRQFGPRDGVEYPIMSYPAHRERLIPALARGIFLHVAMNDLALRFAASTDENRREVESLAAGMKAMSTWYAIDACQNARECCGGQGYLTENEIGRLRRDVDVFATFEGDNVVLLNLLARNLLTGYARSFTGANAWTIAQSIAKTATQQLKTRNPFTARDTGESHLREPEYPIAALDLRAQSLLTSAARRVKKRTDAGMDAFDAFSSIQDHLIALAQAHMEAHIARIGADWVQSLPAGPVRDAMERCRQLVAVDALYRDRAWFQENGLMESAKSRELRKLRMKLIDELRALDIPLANAIGAVDEALASPIGARTPRADTERA